MKRAGQVEVVHVLQILAREVPPLAGRQIVREPLDQRGAVGGPISNELLELDDARADQPTGGSEGGIDRTRCGVSG